MSHTQYLAADKFNRIDVTEETPLPVALVGEGGGGLAVTPSNITAKFRVAFETPELPAFTVVTGTGDIVQTDGNAQAASYVSISKSPWDAGTETSLTTLATFGMPVELAFGAHRSQATLGQEFAFELVDTGTPLPDVADIAIASITQTTTTLTIDTVADHGLVPGKSIGVTGCSDQRANYPSLVVASIPSPRQITCTAGPGGTIPSLTIANPAGAKGSIYFRERLGRANDGMAQIFENASATQASFYIRSRSGDALASGTPNGNHVITVNTTASVQAINAPYTYAFAPTSEYRLNLQADRVQAMDSAVDATAQATSRVMRTQVCPDPDSTYKFRIRAVNNKALTVINAKVVSVVKTGTTTGTFTTDRPHGLVTNDLIAYYGNSNTAASAFPNLTTATAVTVVDATTFTAVIGTASTVTGYGGVIGKVQGGNLPSALGYSAVTAINATLTTLTDGTRQLVLTGSGNWTGLVIGDYVNAEGVSNVTNGALLNVDGAFKVANVATTALTLVPLEGTDLPGDFTVTNCGGAVIKRTCLRVSFVRIFDYERQRVEMLARPSADASAAAPVVIQGGTSAVTQSGTWNVGSITTLPALVASTATIGNVNIHHPVLVADVASAAITSTATTATLASTFGLSYKVQIPVTAVSGTNPTMDVRIEESIDGGTNWFTVYDFPRITATGSYSSPKLPTTGTRVRYVQTIGGTTPSFTRAINRLQNSDPIPALRQLIDRTISLTTLNAATAALDAAECNNVQLVIELTTAGTAPTIQLEGSDSQGGTGQWYPIGSALLGLASNAVQVTVPNVQANRVRARVSVVGATIGAGYSITVKAF